MGLLKLAVYGILLGIGLFFLRNYIKGVKCNLKNRIDDKIVLITGGNSGIGLELAIELAKRGGVIHITCRDNFKCQKAHEEIIDKSGVDVKNIYTHELDLADFQSILKFSNEFKNKVKHLDIQINNAGIMMCPYMTTKDGFEMQIGTNHLGHVLLTNELLELVKKGTNSRIINVASSAHLFGSINKTNINLKEEDYNSIRAYGQSKLANMLHAKKLAQLVKGDNIAVVSLHPGSIATNLQQYWSCCLNTIFKYLGTFMKTTYDGIQTQLCLAVDPDLMKNTGQYFEECTVKSSYHSEFYDDSLAEWLWNHSNELIKQRLDQL